MTKHSHPGRSELFLVRMWTEDTGDGIKLVHGKVQKAVSGETAQFCDWQSLVEQLKAMALNLRDADDEEGLLESQ